MSITDPSMAEELNSGSDGLPLSKGRMTLAEMASDPSYSPGLYVSESSCKAREKAAALAVLERVTGWNSRFIDVHSLRVNGFIKLIVEELKSTNLTEGSEPNEQEEYI